MSFFMGLTSWFNRKKHQPYAEMKEELNRINKNISSLLKDVNEREGKQKIRGTIQKTASHIDEFRIRFEKVYKEHRALITARAGKEASEFFSRGQAFFTSFNRIYQLLRTGVVRSNEASQIRSILSNLEGNADELFKMLNSIMGKMKPRRYARGLAKDPYSLAGLVTRDDVSLSKIIRVMRGFRFSMREGGRHLIVVDLEDGEEACAIAESTYYEKHVRSRLARATGRSNEEIDELVRAA